jgi:hypothetical protein
VLRHGRLIGVAEEDAVPIMARGLWTLERSRGHGGPLRLPNRSGAVMHAPDFEWMWTLRTIKPVITIYPLPSGRADMNLPCR